MAWDRTASPYVGIHIASLLPLDWEITLVHEAVRDVDLGMNVEAVFLSTMDYAAGHTRWLAREFRARGVKVIIGGLYPTVNPSYFADVADAVVAGEAEGVLPSVIADLKRGRLEPLYRSAGPADLAVLPVPRYDLVETRFRAPMSYEATRGCPFACSFCILSALPSPYRRRPIPRVVRDLRAVPASWSWTQRRNLVLWDNNLGADREYCRELCEALVPLKRWWGTQTSIDTITKESARLLGRAGCRVVYIGLESLSQGSLAASNKRHNQVRKYKEKIGWLHSNGVLVMSFFLLGLDGDTRAYIEELPGLIDDIGVDIPIFSFPAPLEGTPFRRELEQAGRLLPGDLNGAMDGSALVFRPRDISPDELELAYYTCMRRTHHPLRAARRVLRHSTSQLSTLVMAGYTNGHYTAFERALARRGIQRIRQRGPWPGPAFSAPQVASLPRLTMPDAESPAPL